MDDILDLHRRAAAEFDRRIAAIGEDQWDRPTPCTDWNVRDLVRHLVYENVWVPDLMAGATVAEVGDRYEGNLLGDDPKGAWQDALRTAIDELSAAGALDRTVHLSYGDELAGEYLAQLTLDHAVHAWDLAQAIGAAGDLDPELVEHLWQVWSPRGEMIRGSGVFADEVDVPADADTQTRLLGLLGRRR